MSERRKDAWLILWLAFLAAFVVWVAVNLPVGEIRRPDQVKCESAGGIYMRRSHTCAFPPEGHDG